MQWQLSQSENDHDHGQALDLCFGAREKFQIGELVFLDELVPLTALNEHT